MLAIQRGIVGDGEPAFLYAAEQDAADFGASAGQGEEGVHHRQTDIVQHPGDVLDRERALRNTPGLVALSVGLSGICPFPSF